MEPDGPPDSVRLPELAVGVISSALEEDELPDEDLPVDEPVDEEEPDFTEEELFPFFSLSASSSSESFSVPPALITPLLFTTRIPFPEEEDVAVAEVFPEPEAFFEEGCEEMMADWVMGAGPGTSPKNFLETVMP